MWQMVIRATVLVTCACTTAASGSSSGFPTKEDLGKALVSAIDKHDADALRSLFPPDDVLSATCKGTELAEKIRRTSNALVDRINSSNLSHVAWRGLDEQGPSDKTAAPGESEEGCEARVPIVVGEAGFNFSVGDDTEGGHLMFGVLKAGSKGWYLFGR